MRYPAIRRRVRPPLPIEPVPLAGGGLELDFGPVLHQLELDKLFEDLAIRWQRIGRK